MELEQIEECEEIIHSNNINNIFPSQAKSKRSILPDLRNHPFSDEIKNMADVVYNKMKHQVRRGNIRNRLVYFCVYSAHLELDYEVDPLKLGKQFGLTSGEVQKCSSIFSPLQTGYNPPTRHATPLTFIPTIWSTMELPESFLPTIINDANHILNKDKNLLQGNPRTVAAGLVHYLMKKYGITPSTPTALSEASNRTKVTIESMFKTIAMIDNK